MSSKDASMEAALLEIAKDLLQASDDLASTDPSASAKLAHEAYEIGRDLGIVRNHLDDGAGELADALSVSSQQIGVSPSSDLAHEHKSDFSREQKVENPIEKTFYRRRDLDDEADDDLTRILDRQKAMLPKPVEVAPARLSNRSTQSLTFEAAQTRRSGWFGWMRSREWRHAG